MKCEARTQEDKQCTLTGSTEVGGHRYCGNHANKVRETQLRDAPQEKHRALIPESEYQDTTDAGRMLTTIRTLLVFDTPDRVLVQMLQAWKAGEL